ncbi:ATP-binding protein [Phenylobacterium immobile]|uniref:ATP-binding protein n=1 Tax=Phenylobacterium immobile TaxID=21 RepID=UPI000B1CAB1D|nr:ATP-binding protein [Phenylobacterium immobile]
MKSLLRTLLRYGAAVLIVATSALAAEVFFRLTHSARLSSIFLLGVLITAFAFGSGPSYFASALAFLVYMFLVDPRYQLSFGSADDFNTLFVFLAVAVLTSTLTGRVRDEAARVAIRGRATAALLDATADFAASLDEAFIRSRLAHHLAAAARGEAVVFGSLDWVATAETKVEHPLIEAAGRLQADPRAPSAAVRVPGWTLRILQADEAVFGVAAWKSAPVEPRKDEDRALVEVLADTGAAAIARARLARAKSEAETLARTEALRDALLSSISHDLRTPLAAIVASASSLHQFGPAFAAEVSRDLAATIQEEAHRLDLYVGNLLSMTKLESGALDVQHIAFDLGEVVFRAARRQQSLHRRSIDQKADYVEVVGDPILLEQALSNVLENAIRYSPAEAPIEVRVFREGGRAVVRITDAGPGVPAADQERIFEKFYRAPNTARSGTGLGLSIARGLIEGMGGVVSATNRPEPERGLIVSASLPLSA